MDALSPCSHPVNPVHPVDVSSLGLRLEEQDGSPPRGTTNACPCTFAKLTVRCSRFTVHIKAEMDPGRRGDDAQVGARDEPPLLVPMTLGRLESVFGYVLSH